MQSRIPHKRSLLCAAISLSLLPIANQSFAQQQEEVEEVVVTGSYIRRSEGFQAASQVTQLSADDLVDEGTLNLGEVVQNLSFVNGPGSAITNTIQGTDSRSTTIDLRGLGGRSTLTLMDGKRLVNENVNALIPTIAIQRMDIVADGAAALYGNEAVAGVVNFIPYTSYDGFKLDTYAEQDERGDYDEHSVQMLWGGQIGDLDLVLAGQFRQSGRLEWGERNELASAGLTLSSNSPGNWNVPVRDANGALTGSSQRMIDPACRDQIHEALVPSKATSIFGIHRTSASGVEDCLFEYGDNRNYREPTTSNQFFANATYDVSDDLTLRGQLFTTRLHETTFSSTSNPGGNTRRSQLPAVRGEIPGNPFRAMDANGNMLFGVDADQNGIPDRGGVDVNSDGWNDYLVSGTTPNGVPLYEDVTVRTLRPINKTMANCSNPTVLLQGHTCDMDNVSNNTDRLSRWFLQADFTVPFLEGWNGQASYTSNYREIDFMSNQNYDIGAMIQGLNCDVANDRDGCYNPFFVTDPTNATMAHVLDDIAARDREQVRDELDVIDIVLTGDIPLGGFELPGGPIGAAIGYQLRDDSFTNTPSLVEIAGDAWIGSTEKENIVTGNREVDAYFAEVSIPILSNLEFEAAVRREEFSTGQKSTDPKFGFTWAVTDWLSVRGTQGDAFIAPTLEQLFNPETCGLGTVTDRFGPFNAFVTQCGGGNPNLTNETSESQQFGFDVALGDFDLSVSWSTTDFQNRIVSTSAQTIMNIEFEQFKQWSGFTGDGLTAATQPSLAQLQAWLDSGQSTTRIERDSQDPLDILLLKTGTNNAETVEVTAWDIQASYRYSLNDWGDFNFGLQATFIDEFLYQETLLEPVVDGAGKYNDPTNAAPNLPEWKANLRINWSRGNHYINTITRYYSDMPYDGPTFSTVLGLVDNVFFPTRIIGGDVNAWTQVDGSYTYRGFEVFGGEAAMTLGMRNMFDRRGQRSPEFAGVIGQLQDPMGRTFYARFVYDF